MTFVFGILIFIAQILSIASARYPIGIMGYDGLIFWRLEQFGPASPKPNDWVANLPFWSSWIFIGLTTLFCARYQCKPVCRTWVRAIFVAIPMGMLLMALILFVFSFLDTDYWSMIIQARKSHVSCRGYRVSHMSAFGPMLFLFACQIVLFGIVYSIMSGKRNWIRQFYINYYMLVGLVMLFIITGLILTKLRDFNINTFSNVAREPFRNMIYLLIQAWTWFAMTATWSFWFPPMGASATELKALAKDKGLNLIDNIPIWQCRTCRYDLTGTLIADRDSCPECGTAIPGSLSDAKRIALEHQQEYAKG